MGLFKTCKDDFLTKEIRKIFKATPVRVPEERIQPLCAVARRKKHASFRGELKFLIEDMESFSTPLKNSDMAEISGKKSKTVDFKFGVKILEGFLKGFDVMPSAGIGTTLNKVQNVAFSFNNVKRKYVDINQFGLALMDKKLNRRNPATNIYFGDKPYDFLVIDSVMTSNEFTLHLDATRDFDLNASVDQIKGILEASNNHIAVDTTADNDITFKGDKQLTFAFSTIQLFINEDDNSVVDIDPTKKQVDVLRSPFIELEHTPFTEDEDDDGLIEWDE